jgi:hypothetical protein
MGPMESHWPPEYYNLLEIYFARITSPISDTIPLAGRADRSLLRRSAPAASALGFL